MCVHYKIRVGAPRVMRVGLASLGIDTGDGADLVTFRTESIAQQLDQTVRINTGAGSDEVKMDVAIPVGPCEIDADIGIDLGAGKDFAAVRVNSAADELALALHIAGQEGSDEILARVFPGSPCEFRADIDLAGGEGTDLVGLWLAAAMGQQPQQELPVLDIQFMVSGGEGKDEVGATVEIGPATGFAEADVDGNEGNDLLSFLAEAPATLQAVLCADGGAGFDRCVATQNVNIMNCEA